MSILICLPSRSKHLDSATLSQSPAHPDGASRTGTCQVAVFLSARPESRFPPRRHHHHHHLTLTALPPDRPRKRQSHRQTLYRLRAIRRIPCSSGHSPLRPLGVDRRDDCEALVRLRPASTPPPARLLCATTTSSLDFGRATKHTPGTTTQTAYPQPQALGNELTRHLSRLQ